MGNTSTKTEINFTIRKTIDIYETQELGIPSFDLFKKFMKEKGYICQPESENYTTVKFIGPHNFLYRLRMETYTDKIRIIAVYHMHPLHDDAWFYDNLNIVDVNHPVRNYKNVEQKLSEFIEHVRDFVDIYKPVQLYSSPSSASTSPISSQASVSSEGSTLKSEDILKKGLSQKRKRSETDG